LTAIEKHLETIKKYSVEKIYAFATSAIRDAGNGKDFIKLVKERYNIYIHIIPGEREAEFIYKGVRKSLDIGDQPALILDIGGGSNEFIIADSRKIFWKKSYNLGMARMFELFRPNDPITFAEIRNIESYLEKELQTLFEAVPLYEPLYLLGASGSFETFFSLLSHLYPSRYISSSNPSREILCADFQKLHSLLLGSTLDQRKKMPGMEPVRVEMIVLASIFVNFTLRKCKLDRIIQSDYSLKEGVVAEMLGI